MGRKNDITYRQNREESIDMLAAQRQLYREGKAFGYLTAVFTVALPLLCCGAQAVLQSGAILDAVFSLISIASCFAGVILSTPTKQAVFAAALIQQQFDLYVYGMEWDNRLFGENKDMDAVISEKSRKYMKKGGYIQELKNWYMEEIGELEPWDAIFACQKTNVCWDVRLKEHYRRAACIAIFLCIGGVLWIGIAQNESITDFLGRLVYICPLLYWLSSTVKGLNENIRTLKDLGQTMDGIHGVDMDFLYSMQKGIYEHRKSECLVPDWFYKYFRSRNEDIARRMIRYHRR